MEKIRNKLAPKVKRLEERIRKAEHRLQRQRSESGQQKLSTAVAAGSSMVRAIFSRRALIGGAASTARGVGRIIQEGGDVDRATEDLAVYKTQLLELEDQLTA